MGRAPAESLSPPRRGEEPAARDVVTGRSPVTRSAQGEWRPATPRLRWRVSVEQSGEQGHPLPHGGALLTSTPDGHHDSLGLPFAGGSRVRDGGGLELSRPRLRRLQSGAAAPTHSSLSRPAYTLAPRKGGLVGEGAASGRPWLRQLASAGLSGAQGHAAPSERRTLLTPRRWQWSRLADATGEGGRLGRPRLQWLVDTGPGTQGIPARRRGRTPSWNRVHTHHYDSPMPTDDPWDA